MSENIVHTAIHDDTRRLVVAAGARFPAVFAEALQQERDLARLGAVTRHADRHSVALLRGLRARWRADGWAADDHAKLAFVLGWLSHRAADRQMKPIFRATCPDSPVSPTDCSVYHDAFILRRRYRLGQDPYHPDLLARMAGGPSGDAMADLRELVRCLVQGTLIGLHTLIPDDDDADGWLERLIARHQAWRVDLERYLQAVVQGDPALEERYLQAVCFYEPEDPLIALCESLQEGGTTDPAALDLAAAAQQASQYAQALQTAWRYLCAAGDHFRGQLDDAGLAAALDHGRPGRDGRGV